MYFSFFMDIYFVQMVGGLCALLGVFILTLPLPIVVNSFSTIYKNRSVLINITREECNSPNFYIKAMEE